jgi:Fe-S cluster biogenesis protein NfuA
MIDAAKNALDRKMNRIESLIESLEKLSNPAARVVAQELVQTLFALHAAGLARMLEIARLHDGEDTIVAWGGDDLVGNMLMLHDLHPVDLETRVRQAIKQVQPLLRCHGADLDLVAVAEKLVRVRLLGECSLSPQELEHTLEEAFAAVAPDVQVIEVENTNTPAQRIALPLV